MGQREEIDRERGGYDTNEGEGDADANNLNWNANNTLETKKSTNTDSVNEELSPFETQETESSNGVTTELQVECSRLRALLRKDYEKYRQDMEATATSSSLLPSNPKIGVWGGAFLGFTAAISCVVVGFKFAHQR